MVIIVILRGHGKLLGLAGINRFAPKFQVPVNPGTGVLVDLVVPNNDSPFANTFLTPVWIVSVPLPEFSRDKETYQCTTLIKVQSA